MGRLILFRRHGTFAGPFITGQRERFKISRSSIIYGTRTGWWVWPRRALPCITESLERGVDINQQQYRVGSEQAMERLGARDLLEGKLTASKASERDPLFRDEATTQCALPTR